MTAVWDKIEELAKKFEDKFNTTGEPIKSSTVLDYDWHKGWLAFYIQCT